MYQTKKELLREVEALREQNILYRGRVEDREYDLRGSRIVGDKQRVEAAAFLEEVINVFGLHDTYQGNTEQFKRDIRSAATVKDSTDALERLKLSPIKVHLGGKNEQV